ncbi:MAG: class I SAM-dependent methyltransferase [Dehalococcoidia bacterium]
MNILHRWYCNSEGWAKRLQGAMIPWTLADADLGDDVLEIGPGPGLSTDWLRSRVARLTSIEIDQKLAQALIGRMEGTNVTVVEGDATDTPFPDGSFSAAVCFTMLHHVPSPELQDRLLAQAHRVLRPGALFLGSDSTPSLRWRLYHVLDDCMPIDPDAFGARLERAGFTETSVDWNRQHNTFRFRARKAA